MNASKEEQLDRALARVALGEQPELIASEDQYDSPQLLDLMRVVEVVQSLAPVHFPSTSELITDRDRFLAGVSAIEAGFGHYQSQAHAVSPGWPVRLREWIRRIPTGNKAAGRQPVRRREKRNMSPLLAKAMILFVFIVTSAGGTLALADSSLPDSPLYPLKLAWEDTRLALKGQPPDLAETHLELALRRTQEMVVMAGGGRTIGEDELDRLEHHLYLAFQNAAQASDQEIIRFLNRAQETIRSQERELDLAQNRSEGNSRAMLGQASGVLARWRTQARLALGDPQTFRRRFGLGWPGEVPEPQEAPSDEPGQNQGNSVPGGPGQVEGCGEQDCQPVGDQNRYGPMPGESPGPGEPGGNPDCPGDACEPAGDAYQNGSSYGPGPSDDHGPYQGGGLQNGPAYGDLPCDGQCLPAGDQLQEQNQERDQYGEQQQSQEQQEEDSQEGERNQERTQSQTQTQQEETTQEQFGSSSGDQNGGGSENNTSEQGSKGSSSSGGDSQGGGGGGG